MTISGKPQRGRAAALVFAATVATCGNAVADQVIPDDLIVQGSTCVGLDCVNNENFGFDTIKLKENNLRIFFEDTSSSPGFPANDWRLIANDSASGGSKFFLHSGCNRQSTSIHGHRRCALQLDLRRSQRQCRPRHGDAGSRSEHPYRQHAGASPRAGQQRWIRRTDLGHRRQRGELLRP